MSNLPLKVHLREVSQAVAYPLRLGWNLYNASRVGEVDWRYSRKCLHRFMFGFIAGAFLAVLVLLGSSIAIAASVLVWAYAVRSGYESFSHAAKLSTRLGLAYIDREVDDVTCGITVPSSSALVWLLGSLTGLWPVALLLTLAYAVVLPIVRIKLDKKFKKQHTQPKAISKSVK